jgi:hypothetical protein
MGEQSAQEQVECAVEVVSSERGSQPATDLHLLWLPCVVEAGLDARRGPHAVHACALCAHKAQPTLLALCPTRRPASGDGHNKGVQAIRRGGEGGDEGKGRL